MTKLQTKMMLLAGLSVIALVPMALASESNQKTTITFSGPVEVPGQILPAGTYIFKLMDSPGSRNIVQILNERQNHVFGTFLAIPDQRLRPAGETLIRFEERPAGSPPAIKAWFYPGRIYGNEFVYPKSRAVELARESHTPVPSMPTELTADTTTAAATMKAPEIIALIMTPLKAEEPSGDEVELADAFPDAGPAPFYQHPALPEELPSTASDLPLVALSGLVLIGTAASLRLAAGRGK